MGIQGFHFPKLPPSHKHMRLLLENAFQYADPVHGIVEPVSGYPAEGWNQEPQNGLFLRSFTQLTAIGTWIELLANIAAGYADNPYLSRESALSCLSLAVKNPLVKKPHDSGFEGVVRIGSERTVEERCAISFRSADSPFPAVVFF